MTPAMPRVIVLGAVTAFLAALTAVFLTSDSPSTSAATPAAATPDRATQIARGEYLTRAGDCTGCHTARDGAAYAGGVSIPTAFGVFYSPNITPDRETGIGGWTSDDFWRALHEGRSRDGTLLYPAFPYTNYTKVSRADSDAMFAYLQTVAPVRNPRRQHELAFPYNQRHLLLAWRSLYFHEGEYESDPAHDAVWNRGAYLVTGLGHCDACHSERNALGAVPGDGEIPGGLIAVQNWYAPALNSNRETGLGDWEVADVVDLLESGVSERGAVFGPMAIVVHQSLQYVSREDLTAMAVYMKAQTQYREAPEPPQVRVPAEEGEALVAMGRKIYEKHCEDCHQKKGEGVPRIYPPLVNNESILMNSPLNAIRIVVNGGFPPSTRRNPRPYGMPPYGQDLSDAEIAAVVSYIRQSWGNHAPPVSPQEVWRQRAIPAD